MAVGKGSLLRAASAAGKGVKAEVQEAVLTEEKKTQSETADEKKVKPEKETDKKGKTEKKSKSEKDAVKKSKTDKPENVSEPEKKSKAENAAETEKKKTAAKSPRRAAAKKQTASMIGVNAQGSYMLRVPVGCLQEIPQEWLKKGYVRPNVSALAESISRCGVLEPLPVVLIQENLYQLVGGSRRMQVIQMLGIEEVPVLVLSGNSMEDAKKLYQELNLITEWEAAAGEKDLFTTAEASKDKEQKKGLFGRQRLPEYLL